MAGNLSQLLATTLQPQRERWHSAAQSELLRTAGRTAVIWEGEPGDVRTVSYAGLQAVQQAVAAEAAPTA